MDLGKSQVVTEYSKQSRKAEVQGVRRDGESQVMPAS